MRNDNALRRANALDFNNLLRCYSCEPSLGQRLGSPRQSFLGSSDLGGGLIANSWTGLELMPPFNFQDDEQNKITIPWFS